jgi:hypothetical protein
MSSTLVPETEAAAQASPGIGQSLHNYWDRVRGGDLGSLPAVAGLIALIIVFTALQGDTFLSAFNFANLINQSAMIIVLAMGLIFVLLLGEIDLSAGFAAGTCAAVLGVTLTERGWPLILALAGDPADRRDHRCDHRRPGGQTGHPQLRRHAGHVPWHCRA